MVMLCAGLSYSYGIYSGELKERYNLDQLQVAGIGTAGNIGGYMAILAGLLYDRLRGLNRQVGGAQPSHVSRRMPRPGHTSIESLEVAFSLHPYRTSCHPAHRNWRYMRTCSKHAS